MPPLETFCPALPYEWDDLEPVLSRKAVERHLTQHHRRLHELAVAAVRGTPFESLSLESLVRVTALQPRYRRLCALATEAWNHDLYWRSLRPAAGGEACGPVGALIRSSFRSFELFARRMKQVAGELRGNGWLWVSWRAGAIEVLTTQQTRTPFTDGHVPLLTIDLWEHAYYPDYDDSRGAYVAACLRNLIDWQSANQRLLRLSVPRRQLGQPQRGVIQQPGLEGTVGMADRQDAKGDEHGPEQLLAPRPEGAKGAACAGQSRV